MSARPLVIILPLDYETGPLTQFLAADAQRQNYRVVGEIAQAQDVVLMRPLPAPPARAAEDLQ